jgi:hypothetical protein
MISPQTESCTAIKEIDDVDMLVGLIKPLWQSHYEETTIKFGVPINPNLELYRSMQSQGRLIALVAFIGDKVVGYSLNFIAVNIHHTDLSFLKNDMIFVLPAYRKKIGLKLVYETKSRAREVSNMMIWTSKEGSPFAKVLRALKCKPQETNWSMDL